MTPEERKAMRDNVDEPSHIIRRWLNLCLDALDEAEKRETELRRSFKEAAEGLFDSIARNKACNKRIAALEAELERLKPISTRVPPGDAHP